MYRAIKYALPPHEWGNSLGRATVERVHLVVARQHVRDRRDRPRLRVVRSISAARRLDDDPGERLPRPRHPDVDDDDVALRAARAACRVGRDDPRACVRQYHECVLRLRRTGAGRHRDGPGDRRRIARNRMEAGNGHAWNGRSRGGVSGVHNVRPDGALRLRLLSVLRHAPTGRESSDTRASAAAMSVTRLDTLRAR